MTERRLRLRSGLEIEFGIAPLSWASTAPLDAGTARVIHDGYIPIFDPDGLLRRLIRAVRYACFGSRR